MLGVLILKIRSGMRGIRNGVIGKGGSFRREDVKFGYF